jgi:UrcA family protein
MKMFFAAALAATALSALAAGSASAQSYDGPAARIPFGDLDLSTTAGAAALDARIDAAARTMCRRVIRPVSRLNDRANCAAAVRAEAMAQLPNANRRDYAMARLPRIDA